MDPSEQRRRDNDIERRLRELEKLVSNLPVKFAAPSGPRYPACPIHLTDKFTNGGTGTNGGFYVGHAVTGTADAAGNHALNTNSNLTMPEGMILDPSDKTCIVMNLAEDTFSTHALTLPGWAIGILVGTFIKDSGNGAKLPNGEKLFAGQRTDIYAISPGGGIPTGTGRYKVLMLLDDLSPGTPGWDFPRFH